MGQGNMSSQSVRKGTGVIWRAPQSKKKTPPWLISGEWVAQFDLCFWRVSVHAGQGPRGLSWFVASPLTDLFSPASWFPFVTWALMPNSRFCISPGSVKEIGSQGLHRACVPLSVRNIWLSTSHGDSPACTTASQAYLDVSLRRGS